MNRRLSLLAACLITTACASLHIEPTDSTPTKITKAVLRVPVAVITLGMSEGYHSTERTMRSWLGHRESELLMAWGPPVAVLDAGDGSTILVYTQERQYVTPGQATTTTTGSTQARPVGRDVYVNGRSTSQTTYTPAQVQTWTVRRQFRVNKDGVIDQYSWQGL
jgi:hypothetical protein